MTPSRPSDDLERVTSAILQRKAPPAPVRGAAQLLQSLARLRSSYASRLSTPLAKLSPTRHARQADEATQSQASTGAQGDEAAVGGPERKRRSGLDVRAEGVEEGARKKSRVMEVLEDDMAAASPASASSACPAGSALVDDEPPEADIRLNDPPSDDIDMFATDLVEGPLPPLHELQETTTVHVVSSDQHDVAVLVPTATDVRSTTGEDFERNDRVLSHVGLYSILHPPTPLPADDSSPIKPATTALSLSRPSPAQTLTPAPPCEKADRTTIGAFEPLEQPSPPDHLTSSPLVPECGHRVSFPLLLRLCPLRATRPHGRATRRAGESPGHSFASDVPASSMSSSLQGAGTARQEIDIVVSSPIVSAPAATVSIAAHPVAAGPAPATPSASQSTTLRVVTPVEAHSPLPSKAKSMVVRPSPPSRILGTSQPAATGMFSTTRRPHPRGSQLKEDATPSLSVAGAAAGVSVRSTVAMITIVTKGGKASAASTDRAGRSTSAQARADERQDPVASEGGRDVSDTIKASLSTRSGTHQHEQRVTVVSDWQESKSSTSSAKRPAASPAPASASVVEVTKKPKKPKEADGSLASRPSDHIDKVLWDILIEKEGEQQQDFHHILPSPSAEAVERLHPLAHMLPLPAVNTFYGDAYATQPLPGSDLNALLASGKLHSVEYFIYEIFVHVDSLAAAETFKSFLRQPAAAAEAAAAGVLSFGQFVDALEGAVAKGRWAGVQKLLYLYVGWSSGRKESRKGEATYWPRPFHHFPTAGRCADETGIEIKVEITFLGSALNIPPDVDLTISDLMLAEALYAVLRRALLSLGAANAVSCGGVVPGTDVIRTLTSLPPHLPVSAPSSLRKLASTAAAQEAAGKATGEGGGADAGDELDPPDGSEHPPPLRRSRTFRRASPRAEKTPFLSATTRRAIESVHAAPHICSVDISSLPAHYQEHLHPYRHQAFFDAFARVILGFHLGLRKDAFYPGIMLHESLRVGIVCNMVTVGKVNSEIRKIRLIVCEGSRAYEARLFVTPDNGYASEVLLRWSSGRRVFKGMYPDGSPLIIRVAGGSRKTWEWKADKLVERIRVNNDNRDAAKKHNERLEQMVRQLVR
ncbi:hypothetical protein JCM10213v2_007750 [Rhodosporidiobolus nylandii]